MPSINSRISKQGILELGIAHGNPFSEKAHAQLQPLAEELGIELREYPFARKAKSPRKLPAWLVEKTGSLVKWLASVSPRFVTQPCRLIASCFVEIPPPWPLVCISRPGLFSRASRHMRNFIAAVAPEAIVAHVDSFDAFLEALALARRMNNEKSRIFIILTGSSEYLSQGKLLHGALAYARYLVLRRKITFFAPGKDVENATDALCFPVLNMDKQDVFINRLKSHFASSYAAAQKNSALFAYRGNSLSGRGAARYAELLCKCMKQHGMEVSMFVPETFTPDADTVACGHYTTDSNIISLFLKILDRLESQYLPYRDFHLLYLYFSHAFNRNLRRNLAKKIQNYSIVGICQQDWIAAIVAMTDSLDIPALCFTVDLMPSRCFFPPARKFFSKYEKDILSKCDFISTVEKNECEELGKTGIFNHLMPTATAFSEHHDVKASLREINFLYVAAKINFNRVGKNYICRLAKMALQAKKNWRFFIIGNCATPEDSTENIQCTGYVSDEKLAEMYRRATMVLAPVPYGTGSSNKAIEAFAFGCPTLGTRIIFRGLPVINGVHCLIEDDIGKYFEIMENAVQNPALLKKLSSNALTLAQDFNYMKAFSPLGDFLQACK